MKLIAEYTENDIQCLVEAKEDGTKNYTIEGVFAQAEQKNRNGRIYPKPVMEAAVKKYAKEQVATKRAVGELNHPESSLEDLERTSHRITECWWDGKILMGKVELLTSEAFRNTGQITCMGDIAANLLLHGVTLGISSRGVGSLKKTGEYNEVQDDFEMVCFDLVSSPSTPGAYLFHEEGDREKYAESIDEKEDDVKNNKTLALMNKLNSFLGK